MRVLRDQERQRKPFELSPEGNKTCFRGHGAPGQEGNILDFAGCYGFDIGTNLIDLTRSLLEVEGDYIIRIGMMNPEHALKMLPGLAEILNNERVYSFAHVPVQSGSDKVLKAMNRFYTSEDFQKIVSYLRESVQDVTIATDIIVGFPGETDEDHTQTLNLLEETKPDVINVSKFYPRPNTLAEKMPKISTQIIKTRSVQASALARKISAENNSKYVGRMMNCLAISENVCRTRNYKTVFTGTKLTPGTWHKVEITGYGASHLKAKLL